MRWINRQTRAINIPTLDKQIERGNQYTYLGIRQTRTINILTMDEKIDKGIQYSYQRTKRQRDKGIQYTYDG